MDFWKQRLGGDWRLVAAVQQPSLHPSPRGERDYLLPYKFVGNSHELIRQTGIPAHPCLLLMSHPNRGFLAPKWGTHHFWEIHICGAAPLSINARVPICEGLVAARMTLCAVVNSSHPHIPETHQESRMKLL